MTIGTGIGGAIVLGGEVYRGINNSAGAFGQVRITDAAKWEELASLKRFSTTPALIIPTLRTAKNCSPVMIVASLRPKSRRCFYRYLAVGIANLAYVFSRRKSSSAAGFHQPAFFGELTADQGPSQRLFWQDRSRRIPS